MVSCHASIRWQDLPAELLQKEVSAETELRFTTSGASTAESLMRCNDGFGAVCIGYLTNAKKRQLLVRSSQTYESQLARFCCCRLKYGTSLFIRTPNYDAV